MDKYTRTYLNIITEDEGKGPLIVMDDVDDTEEPRYLLRVGNRFASSPLTKLTTNPNFAGVVHGKNETDFIIKYYQTQGIQDIELIPWEERDKVLQ